VNDEQQMLRDSAERYLRDNYDFAARQAIADQGIGIDEQHWQNFVAMGWTAMSFTEQDGGFGFGLAAIGQLAELFGYHLVREPMLESALLAGEVIAAGAEQAKQSLLPAIMDGSALATIPYPTDAGPELSERHGRRTVRGRLEYVPSGGTATHLVTPASHGSAPAWVVVDLRAPGVQRQTFLTHDGRLGAHVTLDTELEDSALLLSGDDAQQMQTTVYQRAMLLAAAEGVGAMQGALDLTVDYTRQRQQFGQPLSAFQALQHRMADMLIQVELARSLVTAACNAVDSSSDQARTLSLAAKAKVDAAARRVTQEAIQMHGGIATTNEYRVGHYFKRMALLESWPQHRDQVIEAFIQGRQPVN